MGLFRRKPLHQRLAEEGGLVEREPRPLFTGVPRAALLLLPPWVLPLVAEPGMWILYGARSVRRALLHVPRLGRSKGKRLLKAAFTILVNHPDADNCKILAYLPWNGSGTPLSVGDDVCVTITNVSSGRLAEATLA